VATFSAELTFRGLVHQVTSSGLLARLDAGAGRPLTAYIGFDPSAPSLHVGNLMQLCTLRRLQMAGHRPIALAGGATGMIGDPGGKTGERQLLGADELVANLDGIRPQLERFLDFSEGAGAARALLLDNSAWLAPMGMVEFLRDVGKHFTVNQMVAKESVRSRFERADVGISYTEFSYMLLQAYDFFRLHVDHGCELQVGGSDQWGNITMGVDLVRKLARTEVYGLTTPLVTKPDGTKFGKTESGTVWLDPSLTSPYRFYQFLLQSEDAAVGGYLRYFTFLGTEEIAALDEETVAHPERRAAQRALARSVTEMVHGLEQVQRAEKASAALFGTEISDLDEDVLVDVMDDAPSSALALSELATGVSLVDLMVKTGLSASKGEARRAVAQGGAYVNNRRVAGEDQLLGQDDLLHGRYLVLRRGRRDYHMVRVQ